MQILDQTTVIIYKYSNSNKQAFEKFTFNIQELHAKTFLKYRSIIIIIYYYTIFIKCLSNKTITLLALYKTHKMLILSIKVKVAISSPERGRHNSSEILFIPSSSVSSASAGVSVFGSSFFFLSPPTFKEVI